MLKKYDKLISKTLESIFSMISGQDEQLNKIVRDYFSSGGKRIRILLSLICAELGDFKKNEEKIIKIASIVEIIHTASLIHDDIIDKADTRRGKITLNTKFDDYTALYIGDYLFSIVLNEIAKFDDKRLHNYLAKTLKELCIGEIIQYNGLYNINTRRLDYLKKIKRKTAILIAFACVSGAIVAGADDEKIKASYNYGYYLGMSYQIIDDYLDFVGGSDKLGKRVGQDIMNGNITLPALLAKEKNNKLFENYSNNSSNEEKLLIVNYIKNDNNILTDVLAISQKYLKKAEKMTIVMTVETREKLLIIMNELARRDR